MNNENKFLMTNLKPIIKFNLKVFVLVFGTLLISTGTFILFCEDLALTVGDRLTLIYSIPTANLTLLINKIS